MSSRSKLVQINRSLIILDPQTMPANLAQTVREDAPEQGFPCLAYDGHNILPTALGYQSYFGEQNRLNIGNALADKKVQQIFQYQTVNMRTLSIALCENGLYLANSSEGPGSFNWQLVLDFTASEVAGVRRLWTFCVISNKLYVYQQGQGKVYAVVNAAEYQETTIPAGIAGATIEQVWFNATAQTGILALTPNFINMAGQIGIFKAGNRLGLWDSEGAVAWSSATQVYDFKPSTSNFAGITTFTDVVGKIVMIKQHGTGFIIYATRSITACTPLSGSPEKWSGRAIFSDVGVVFDTQIVVAQPDSMHFAITSGGLCAITNGNPEYIEPEVMDYVRNSNEVYALSYLDSRYLAIHTTKKMDAAAALPTITVEDLTGEGYQFPPPVALEGDTFLEWLENQVNGINGPQQFEFGNAQEPVEGMVKPTAGEALIPCWSGKGLETTFDERVLTAPKIQETILIQSGAQGSSYWHTPVELFRPRYTAHRFEAGDQFFDKAGEEFIKELTKTVELITTSNAITIEGVQKFSPVDIAALDSEVKAYYGTHDGITTSRREVPELSWYWRNVPVPLNFDGTEGNECAIQLNPVLRDVKFTVFAEMTERTVVGEAVAGQILFGYADANDNYQHAEPALCLMATPSSSTVVAFTPLNPAFNDLLKSCYSEQWSAQLPPPYDTLNTFLVASEIKTGLIGTAFAIGANNAGTMVRSVGLNHVGDAVVKFMWSLGKRATLGGGPGPWNTTGSAFDQESAATAAIGEEYCYSIGTYKRETRTESPTARTYTGTNFPHFMGVQGKFTHHLSPEQLSVLNELLGETSTLELLGLSLVTEVSYEPQDPTRIFEAEVSGYGYFPYGGFSFRKTHQRSIFKPCAPTGLVDYTFNPEDSESLPGIGQGVQKELPGTVTLNPPYSWDYPATIPMTPNYVLFQEGTLAPYYPTYEEAVLLDTQLNKWGRYNNPHKVAYSLFPINRTDQTIMPVGHGTLRAGALSVDGWCSVFSSENQDSRITYGKIGDYRLGWTRATKVVTQFGYPSTAYTIIETSINGDTIDESLSQAITVSGLRRAELPFTLAGKWFNIRLEGQFNIVGLSLESEARSRR